MVGFLLAGVLVSKVGRKWSVIMTAVPGLLGSALICMSINTYKIIVGRFLEGITNGMMNVAVFIYASEIADVKIRGRITMLCFLMVQSGGIFTIALGTKLTWYYMSLVCFCVLSVHCLLAGPTLNESPSFLAIKKRDEEALKVLRSLRGPDADIQEELRYLQKQNSGDTNKQGYRDLLQKEHLQKIGIMSVIFFIHNFCGTQVMRVNATRIIRSFGTQLDEKVMAILIIGTLLVGNTSMTTILDWYGRRRCIMTSLSTVTVAYTCLGTYVYLKNNYPSLIEGGHNTLPEAVDHLTNTSYYLSLIGENNYTYLENADDVNDTSNYLSLIPEHDTSLQKHVYNMTNMNAMTNASDVVIESFDGSSIKNWLPVMIFTIAGFGHSIGIGPLVFVLSPEMFPTTLRSQGTSICTMIGSLQTFAVLQLYSVIDEHLTHAGLFWMFAIVSGSGVFFVYKFLKETSGSRVG
ncbi:facilitated trehalose transporter Tret1-like [Palaemon carinicauda]|uniref:facilitated trehalose transporter Tret1-like n=1 Tax=Palaemon carinicauda TaxID=392227 RepID=UPI0035B58FE6